PARYVVNPLRLKVGVIGSPAGIALYCEWVDRLSKPILPGVRATTSVFYPGFRELFSCDWPATPDVVVTLAPSEISNRLRLEQRHEAVFKTVGLFADGIARSVREEEVTPDLWFVVIPDEVYQLARPKSFVPTAERVKSDNRMTANLAKKLQREPSLFDSDMAAAEPYLFDLDFRNQLKARLIDCRAVTQIVRESTLQSDTTGTTSSRRLQDAATVAWNLSTSSFYKCGGKPWRLADTREGVCYVGLVFKKDATGSAEENACCGAQMFLTNGDGMVFKGRLGPWYSDSTHEFHLSSVLAEDISRGVAESYKEQIGTYPAEIFIHGRTRFNETEWRGFQNGAPTGTAIVGVRITRSDEMKLYRPGQMPVLRGTSILESERLGYLWSSGFVPDLGTYPGWETPNPLRVEITHGNAGIRDVVSDVLNITKLNFNTCIYGDGLPVTLRFADSVGEILTAAPNLPNAPLPFKHYI
ncbi:MAG: hypothetical protein NTY41_16145, partial [Proteobacteria bacterium]|nr:hypothetical protein [Pseudomonadota bacterium]